MSPLLIYPLVMLAILVAVFLLIVRPWPCRYGGRTHPWRSPVFRYRVCPHCKRREVFMRQWEFDGYDKAAPSAAVGQA